MGSPARPTRPGERYERPSPRHGQRAATASSSTSRLPTISVINRQAPPQASTRDGGAVVPFNSSRRGSLHTEDQPVVISTRRVCPTCMRPFGTDQEHYGYFSDEPRPDFTPQYFRSLPLLPNVATLAIQDHDATHTTTTSATTAEPPRMRHTARPSPRRTDVVEEDPGHGAMGPPICTYVSPTGLLPSHAQAWETVRCRNDEDNEEEEAMRRQSRASTQSDGRSREATQRSNEERTPSPKPPTDFGMQGYYKRYFLEVQKLGSGSFGGVYLCQHIMEGVPLGTFALKKIPVGDNPTYLQNVLREVRILEEVKRHPNVVEYNHSWVEEAQLADFGPPVRCLFILMEYASEGSLDAYLERQGSSLSTIAVWYFFLSAVAGTAHLHEKAILHRDLKPQNLLLSGPAGKPPRVLVSDFGTAAVLDEVGYERSGGTGTLEYMAPELLECDPSVTMERYVNRHTMASDVWSLGMILYFLACDGSLPQRRPDGSVVVDVAAASSIPRPREMVELIRAMLQRDPKRRPSCHDIINSTVAQTILRSFNKSAMTEEDLLPPSLHNRSGPTVPPYSSAAPAPSKMPPSIAMPQIALEDKLESSRVELLNTTVVDDPLLLQYMRQNGHGSPNRVQAPDDSPTGFQGGRLFPKRHRISSPTPSLHLSLQRPRMVDGACQTDPVRFAE